MLLKKRIYLVFSLIFKTSRLQRYKYVFAFFLPQWRKEREMCIYANGKFLAIVVILSGIALSAASGLAKAESTLGTDTFRLNVGGFLPAVDSALSISSKNLNTGTQIDLEDDLGFDEDVTLAQVSGYWRFAPRHRILAGYYAFDRDASKSITEEIQIGDKLFDIGASVYTNWEIDFFQVSYAYSFLQTEKLEVSGSVGLYYLDTEITLRGEGFISDGQGGWTVAGEISDGESVGLPIPLLGLAAELQLSPKWRAKFGGRYFTLSIDEWSGHILEATAALEFLFHKNFGIGTGYSYFDINVERDREARVSELDYTYGGVQIYGIFYF